MCSRIKLFRRDSSEAITVAALFFNPLHGLIGTLDQALPIPIVSQIGSDPDARSDMELVRVDLKWRA